MKIQYRVVLLLTLIFFIFVSEGCGRPAGLSGQANSLASSSYTASATFSSINANIIQPICLKCHNTQTPLLTSYANIMASGIVIAGNATGSQLYIQTSTGMMPYQETPLSTGDVQAIQNWIQAGAPND